MVRYMAHLGRSCAPDVLLYLSYILMSETSGTPPLRPWREIARDLTHETNRQRILELSQELSLAYKAQCHTKPQSTQPPAEAKADRPMQNPNTE